MDLQAFLALEKQRLADERQRLNEYSDELNTPRDKPTSSKPPQHVNKSRTIAEETFSKNTKDWFNQQQNEAEVEVKDHKKKKKDDMEQWVSDTFYSYFPGFNNEYQKRQNDLQKKMLENQENLIRHQMLNAGQSKRKKNHNVPTSHLSSARSNQSSITSNGTATLQGAAKTDLEIINVNNPNYIASKHSIPTTELRPDSARYKLLKDLRHTTLTNILTGNAEDINRKQAELDLIRKKEYQRELMQQIEDKRRSIKLLRDKELQQDEVLTRRLQEQLKTMNLEEQLEKERLKAVKVRFDAEQNRLSREQLLAKLENDSKLLYDTDAAVNSRKMSINMDMNKENRNDNKIYKYFSNSEKHEYSSYRNKSIIPTEIDLEEDQTEIAKIEKECFHLSEKICPVCDGPLKELDNFCLCCQNKLTFRLKLPSGHEKEGQNMENNTTKSGENAADDTNSPSIQKEKDRSFFMVCVGCESLYSWCLKCASKSDVCRACQNKRNLCMNCRKTLCSFCLEEVACGKDIESLHINDSASVENDKMNNNTYSSKESSSFHVMHDPEEVNKSSNRTILSPETSKNNLSSYNHNPPYSINIEQNSIFHPNHKPSLFALKPDPNLELLQEPQQNYSFLGKENSENFIDIDDKNIERLRRDNDKRLTRYLRNYGEFAYQSRGTQTTPNTSARRDIVLQGEHSLSIPLLREMPKMIRTETVKFKQNSKDLENLQRRWDIPAVQKYTISQVSPKVVTQVGAIRKQLQVENIFSDDGDS